MFHLFWFISPQLVRNARDRAESAVAEKLGPLTHSADGCQEIYNEYKIYKEMSFILSKVFTQIRKNKETTKSLDKLEEQLKNGEFDA